MTTEALRGTTHDPAHISPSNLIRKMGERYSRYLFSPNPPPLNIPREGPTQRDREFVNSSRNAQPQEPKGGISSRDVFLVAGTSISTVGLTLGGQILINRVFGAEPISEPTPASRDIGSVPGGTSFTNDGFQPQLEGLPPHLQTPIAQPPTETTNGSSSSEAIPSQPRQPKPANEVVPSEVSPKPLPEEVKLASEIKKNNPDGVFDNTKTKGTFTEQNSVTMTPREYKDTSPQLINGDSVFIPLPIEFPEGQTPNVKLKKEKGEIFGGKRHINGRMENNKFVSDGTVAVNDVLIISGVPEGSVLLSPFDGEIRFSTSSGYENPDGTLKLAAFFLDSKDSNGNSATLTFSTVRIKPLIKPSRIEYEEGTNHTKPLAKKPINAGDPIGIISTTRHDNPHYDGQIHISALSSVEENGQRRGGAAGIEIATNPEGQAIRLDRNSD